MTDPTDLIAQADEVLKWLSPGKPVQFHPRYCEEAKGTPRGRWDTSHELSLIRPDGTRYRIGTFKHADDAAFDQHARQLVPALRDALAAALARAEAAECHAEALEAERDRMRIALQQIANTDEGWLPRRRAQACARAALTGEPQP